MPKKYTGPTPKPRPSIGMMNDMGSQRAMTRMPEPSPTPRPKRPAAKRKPYNSITGMYTSD